MVNPNVLYSVTGRYMDGQKIIGYHLVGEDGSQAQEDKERVKYLISNGTITNMRLQSGINGESIIRGKGVNLNNLPVYDMGKHKFREDETSQAAASGVGSVNKLGQYTILRRIMYKNQCLGYEVQDYSGKILRKTRQNTIDLAVKKLISNAIACKYKKQGEDLPSITLRGVDVDLGKLPVLVVDEHGKIIDPNEVNKNTTFRGVYMKKNGVIKNLQNNKVMQFRCGDFILCGANGEIIVKSRQEVEKYFDRDTVSKSALCDDYVGVTYKYQIEAFGNCPINITNSMVKSWSILKYKDR